jgi:hypothetical protein
MFRYKALCYRGNGACCCCFPTGCAGERLLVL